MSNMNCESSIERCPHDKENPYAQINRDLIRDRTLSPRCKWFIIYCLSFDSSWKISIPFFIHDQNVSKDTMYAILNEAIKAGYVKRTKYLEQGLKRYRYTVSETPKFKECLPCPENPDTVKPDTVKPDSKKKQSSSNEDKKEQCKEGSAAAVSLAHLLLSKILESRPKLRQPNLDKWASEMENLLGTDKRDYQEIAEVISWLHQDDWYKANILSPKSLRIHFDRIQAAMELDSSKARIRENRNFAVAVHEQYKKETAGLTFDKKYVINPSTSKELKFDLPRETFRRELFRMFGGEYGGD